MTAGPRELPVIQAAQRTAPRAHSPTRNRISQEDDFPFFQFRFYAVDMPAISDMKV
jgi:hypothetical protein